eukprot:6179293-Amphidinium_carterae.1
MCRGEQVCLEKGRGEIERLAWKKVGGENARLKKGRGENECLKNVCLHSLTQTTAAQLLKVQLAQTIDLNYSKPSNDAATLGSFRSGFGLLVIGTKGGGVAVSASAAGCEVGTQARLCQATMARFALSEQVEPVGVVDVGGLCSKEGEDASEEEEGVPHSHAPDLVADIHC